LNPFIFVRSFLWFSVGLYHTKDATTTTTTTTRQHFITQIQCYYLQVTIMLHYVDQSGTVRMT